MAQNVKLLFTVLVLIQLRETKKKKIPAKMPSGEFKVSSVKKKHQGIIIHSNLLDSGCQVNMGSWS